jgi:hypothetical protein
MAPSEVSVVGRSEGVASKKHRRANMYSSSLVSRAVRVGSTEGALWLMALGDMCFPNQISARARSGGAVLRELPGLARG